jgi:hypothetical protein
MRLQPRQEKALSEQAKGLAAKGDSRRQWATSLRDVLSYLALTGCALAFLWHFANIWLYGVTQAAEPNLVIRGCETALFVVLLGLGIERMTAAVRKKGRI